MEGGHFSEFLIDTRCPNFCDGKRTLLNECVISATSSLVELCPFLSDDNIFRLTFAIFLKIRFYLLHLDRRFEVKDLVAQHILGQRVDLQEYNNVRSTSRSASRRAFFPTFGSYFPVATRDASAEGRKCRKERVPRIEPRRPVDFSFLFSRSASFNNT